MQILNLINEEKSDIEYSISRFPDGEVQITLGEFSHKDGIAIYCRITNVEELFILMQVCDIIRRHGMEFEIYIYYLMSMRMDRVMDFNRPFSLSIVCNMLDGLGATCINIYCPHSSEYRRLFKQTMVIGFPSVIPIDFDKYQLVFPDEDALDRYRKTAIGKYILGIKSRDLFTGRIISISVDNPEDIDGRPLLIRDDLCDGGGTFLGIAKAIREVKPDAKISISVDHMVNPRGIENLAKTFDSVLFTNSYKTWENLPENVTQIEVI